MTDSGSGAPRGPLSWENWQQWDTQAERTAPAVEGALYSDAHVTNELQHPQWPYHFLLGFSDPGTADTPAVVVREWWVHEGETAMGATDDSTYHGGSQLDELAALVACGLGIRCRAGGIIRDWTINADPLGRPYGFWDRKPYLPLPAREGQMLPSMRRTVDFAHLEPLLDVYRRTNATVATALVRAARLYEQAVWVADDDANLSWLYLVSAAETAAAAWSGGVGTPVQRLREYMPDLAKVAEPFGEDLVAAIAERVEHLTRATAKFVEWMDAYKPAPPEQRPPEFCQVDFNDFRQHMKKIYRYRSRALHTGIPFPAPMCLVPRNPTGDEIPCERPFGQAMRMGDSVWQAADTPMHLAHFEYLVRGALHGWWRGLV
jgi:hypothetical protein